MSDTEDSIAAARALARRQRRQDDMEEEMIRESGGEENVMVCIRVRPFNRRELELQRVAGETYIRSVIEMPEGMGGKVVALEKVDDNYNVVEEFQFTKSFWSISDDQQPYAFAPCTQEDVFEAVGIPVLKNAFAGFHNCVFAYGQTGSGKTHTMMGDFAAREGQLEGCPGIIPQLCKELFERIDARREHVEKDIQKTIEVQLSAIEIYNEQVRDLFYRSTPGRAKTTIMKVRKHPTEGAFVDQLTVLKPKSWEHCLKLIETGVSERTVAATLMNDESSRSHSVFQITITQTESVHVRSDDPNDRYLKPVTNTRVSRINLVDLAGSERVKKSGAQGANLKEAATINQSLSTLKKVIDALVTNSKETNPKKHIMIPFRESMLTMLLSHSLGGNSKTTMIACVSPHHDNQEETLLTLRYANRASGIVNHTRVNEDDATKKALQLKHQILALQRRLEEGEDEEAEELKDQLEVGRVALVQLEKERNRLESEAAEMKSRTKQEEGARFASAFYNTVKMKLLMEQMENLEVSIRDTEERLARETQDIEGLQKDLDKADQEELETEKAVTKLEREAHDHVVTEMNQTLHHQELASNIEAARRKLDSEMELRWAQRLVNARRMRKLREEQAKELEQLQAENDVSLTAVILQAAEQYEQRVRQFADEDTQVQNRIRKAEEAIPKLGARREEVEKQIGELQQAMRNRDREHAARIDEIELTWKRKYAEMKASFESRLATVEAVHYKERSEWDQDIDEEDANASVEHLDTISELESTIRTKETMWAGRVAGRCADVAEKMDLDVKKAMDASTMRVAEVRHQYERRIGNYVAHLRHLESMCDEHDASYELLSVQVAPVTRLFEDVKTAPLPANASPEYRRLHGMLREYSSTYNSVPPKSVHEISRATTAPNGGSPSMRSSPASPQRRSRGVVLPPVEFYPTSPAKK
jgi:hypothetical protein